MVFIFDPAFDSTLGLLLFSAVPLLIVPELQIPNAAATTLSVEADTRGVKVFLFEMLPLMEFIWFEVVDEDVSDLPLAGEKRIE